MSLIHKAERRRALLRLALVGPSGCGKTYSAILLAQGLAGGDLSKVAMVDTEHGSGELYAHLGPYDVLTMEQPFSPAHYTKCVEAITAEGYKVLIIDSLTQEWAGPGGCLDMHTEVGGKSTYTAWKPVKHAHGRFLDLLQRVPCHLIVTMLTKTEYELRGGTPIRVGTKVIQSDGIEREFTTVLELDDQHQGKARKDRTELFSDKQWKLTPDLGGSLLKWLDAGTAPWPASTGPNQAQDKLDNMKREMAGGDE